MFGKKRTKKTKKQVFCVILGDFLLFWPSFLIR